MDEYLVTETLADVFHTSPRTVERARAEGTGPPFIKFGRRILYRKEDVDEWARENTFTSTAEARSAKANEAAELARRYEERQRTIAEAKAEAARRYPQQKRRRDAAGQAKEARE